MLPRPTEAPAADKTNPNLPEKLLLFLFHVYSKLRPPFLFITLLRRILRHTVPVYTKILYSAMLTYGFVTCSTINS